ncbi:p53 negative regulator [Olea europaea subsp. europaea]|uniref:p53 negative regulator n=1 Tax=Olea europaea subsp. europaea TaxID=158383 RepID=A0A8S0PY50_OLEEU|nr:p53 negative regulator [Olea europaea subsp. europaea]
MSDSGGAPPADDGGVVASDQEIAEALGSLLRDCTNNNSFASLNDVVRQLESKLGFNLSHKIDFIRNQIHSFILFQSQPPNFLSHQNQQKDHFALQHTPNFHPGPSAQPNFAVHRPENYGYRPAPHQLPPPQQQHQPSPPPPPPPPHAAVKTSNVAAVSVAASGNPKESAPTGRKRRGGPGGLNKLCGVSPELQTIVGQPALPRTEIVKQLWAYIRKNNLQDPNNKRKIICNEELRLVFETDCTDMFKMNKLLAKHIIPLEPTKQTAQNFKKPKVDVESGSQNDDPVPIVIISEALANFFGSDEREMSRAEVLRQIWEYIKVHQLEVCNQVNGFHLSFHFI